MKPPEGGFIVLRNAQNSSWVNRAQNAGTCRPSHRGQIPRQSSQGPCRQPGEGGGLDLLRWQATIPGIRNLDPWHRLTQTVHQVRIAGAAATHDEAARSGKMAPEILDHALHGELGKRGLYVSCQCQGMRGQHALQPGKMEIISPRALGWRDQKVRIGK